MPRQLWRLSRSSRVADTFKPTRHRWSPAQSSRTPHSPPELDAMSFSRPAAKTRTLPTACPLRDCELAVPAPKKQKQRVRLASSCSRHLCRATFWSGIAAGGATDHVFSMTALCFRKVTGISTCRELEAGDVDLFHEQQAFLDNHRFFQDGDDSDVTFPSHRWRLLHNLANGHALDARLSTTCAAKTTSRPTDACIYVAAAFMLRDDGIVAGLPGLGLRLSHRHLVAAQGQRMLPKFTHTDRAGIKHLSEFVPSRIIYSCARLRNH